MSEPIDPVRSAADRRAKHRREAERRKAEPGTALVVLSPQPTPEPAPAPEAAFTAQVLGQSGQTRGLKGGTPVLEQARTAYLGAAFSGPSDRRPRPGRVTKTEV